VPSDINRTFEPLLLVTDDNESTFVAVENRALYSIACFYVLAE